MMAKNQLETIASSYLMKESMNNKHSESGLNLFLKLTNNSFLSLPILDCYKVARLNSSNESGSDLQVEDHLNEVFDGCQIDWLSSKIVAGGDSSPVTTILNYRDRLGYISNRSFKNGVLLSKLVQNSTMGDRNSSLLDAQHLWLNNLNRSSDTSRGGSFAINDEILFESYLSLSSLLALCGLLINLFIISIIIFNTKQKRGNSNSTRCAGGNSCQKNSLLFQLTLTGLILTSYVLIENYGLYMDLQMGGESVLGDEQSDRLLPEDPNSIRNFLSRLSSLLPPTPFKRPPPNEISPTRKLCDSIESPLSRFTNYKNLVLLVKLDKRYASGSESDLLHQAHMRKSNLLYEFEFKDLYLVALSQQRNLKVLQAEGHGKQRRELKWQLSEEGEVGSASAEVEPEVEENIDYEAFGALEGADVLDLVINVIASVHIWTVAMLAYDRYYAISNPLQYLRSYHGSRRLALFVAIWGISIALALLLPLSFRSMVDTDQWNLCDSPAKMNRMNMSQLSPAEEASQVELLGEVLDLLHRSEMVSNSSLAIRNNYIGTVAETLASLSLTNQYNSLKNESLPASPVGPKSRVGLLLASSLLCFGIIILCPLSIISICNISIYRIVKVHQRRLSLSSITTTGAPSNCPEHNPIHHCRRYNSVVEDRGSFENASLSSLLVGRPIRNKQSIVERSHFRQASSDDLAYGGDEALGLCQTGCNCEPKEGLYGEVGQRPTEAGEMEEVLAGLTNRSKRLVERQDSYQKIMACIQQQQQRQQAKPIPTSQPQAKETNCVSPTISCSSPAHQRNGLKRKLSDYSIIFGCRRNSTSSHYVHDSNVTGQSLEKGSVYLDSLGTNYTPGSIMQQLKMAGLSFAGIPLRRHSSRLLSKSSSCSLANLNGLFGQNQHAAGSVSGPEVPLCRSSLEQFQPRRSYVSLQSSQLKQEKYPTRLHSDGMESDGSHVGSNLNFQQTLANHTQNNPSCQRFLPAMTLGTKSAAFNSVIWIIMTMLVLTLLHFLLVSVKQIMQATSESSHESGSTERALARILGKLSPRNGSLRLESVLGIGGDGEGETLRLVSLWFACLCRLLFLSTIPLNCWLYGIRSRSLKATIRMILKRYISRRQASIEIGQRQRQSVSSSLKSSKECALLLNLSQQQQDLARHKLLVGSGDPAGRKSQLERSASYTSVRSLSSESSRHGSQQGPPGSGRAASVARANTFDRKLGSSCRSYAARSLSVDDNSSESVRRFREKHAGGSQTRVIFGGSNFSNKCTTPKQTFRLHFECSREGSSLNSSPLSSSSRSIVSANSSAASASVFDAPLWPQSCQAETQGQHLNSTIMSLLSAIKGGSSDLAAGDPPSESARAFFSSRNPKVLVSNQNWSADYGEQELAFHRLPSGEVKQIITPAAEKTSQRRKRAAESLLLGFRGSKRSRKRISKRDPDMQNATKGSQTSDNLDGSSRGDRQQVLGFSSNDENSARKEGILGRNESVGSAGSYLKPPNFVKIIFDNNQLVDAYGMNSALSPIKECSSNHSYTSSQSSLNNNTQNLVNQNETK